MSGAIIAFRLTVIFAFLVRFGATAEVSAHGAEAIPERDTAGTGSTSAIAPKGGAAARQMQLREDGVNWTALFQSCSRFLAIEHGFRIMSEPGTRAGLKGSFFQNYAGAVSNLHGWADGDEFYVNYVGHPMQGSVAGFLWIENDRKYRRVEFGKNRDYWKSRLRATAFMWAYSTQFEIGPFSEASFGAIQASFPQQGFVDHVVTPSIGLGWMIAEDALDEYLIKRIEGATTNRWLRLLARGAINPARSFANLLQTSPPWHRETRLGVTAFQPSPSTRNNGGSVAGAISELPPDSAPAPFEFEVTYQPEWLWASGRPLACQGGGATAAFRVAPSWQLAVDVAGCKMIDPGPNLSGDSLTYMAGPRWVHGGTGPWTGHWGVSIGGNKMTMERLWPERKKLIEAVTRPGNDAAPLHPLYTEQVETNGFAVATSGGVDYKLNRALAIRVAEVSYRYSWIGPLWGREYNNGLKLTSGLVLRIGTW